jgi:hypothetical protein
MRLIAATSELVMSGHPYPDFPILLWDTMESCAPVNQFFRYYLLRGAIGSSSSIEVCMITSTRYANATTSARADLSSFNGI